MADKVLTDGEDAVMRAAFEATMRRAADIIDRLTQADVEEAQTILFVSGCTVAEVARIDRAMLGASYLRACAAGVAEDARERIRLLREGLSAGS